MLKRKCAATPPKDDVVPKRPRVEVLTEVESCTIAQATLKLGQLTTPPEWLKDLPNELREMKEAFKLRRALHAELMRAFVPIFDLSSKAVTVIPIAADEGYEMQQKSVPYASLSLITAFNDYSRPPQITIDWQTGATTRIPTLVQTPALVKVVIRFFNLMKTVKTPHCADVLRRLLGLFTSILKTPSLYCSKSNVFVGVALTMFPELENYMNPDQWDILVTCTSMLDAVETLEGHCVSSMAEEVAVVD
jgi:hypothetical protein